VAGHTVKAFDRDLESVGRGIAELGRLAETMVVQALESLMRGDAALAQSVITTGLRLVELRRRHEAEAIRAIARRAPVAADLREVVAAIRIAGDLGRIGHHAQTIANHTIRIGEAAQIPRAIAGLGRLRALAADLLAEALTAYAQRDAQRAWSVWGRDAELDTLEGTAFVDLLSQMIDDPRSITYCTHVLSASRAIERIGDHATNIAETVIYLVTGAVVADERPRGRGPPDIPASVARDAF